MHIQYRPCQTEEELLQILDLQKRNLITSIKEDEIKTQGFLTIQHDLENLRLMNQTYPHIIATKKEKVVGYALSMLREFEKTVPILVPMFEEINAITYQGEKLNEANYFVMGQICVDKECRGQGVFKKLYEKLRDQMSKDFKYLITEVSKRNIRSTKAHLRAGFKNIKEYQSTIDQEEWIIFLWDCK